MELIFIKNKVAKNETAVELGIRTMVSMPSKDWSGRTLPSLRLEWIGNGLLDNFHDCIYWNR